MLTKNIADYLIENSNNLFLLFQVITIALQGFDYNTPSQYSGFICNAPLAGSLRRLDRRVLHDVGPPSLL